jgi:hypothetical protein
MDRLSPDYPIEVTRNEALWGFGDAVCVPVLGWIAKNVLTQLFPTRTVSLSRRQATKGKFLNLHSQMTAVRHPALRNASRTRLSRLRLLSIFRLQSSTFEDGKVELLQPLCACQKQP